MGTTFGNPETVSKFIRSVRLGLYPESVQGASCPVEELDNVNGDSCTRVAVLTA